MLKSCIVAWYCILPCPAHALLHHVDLAAIAPQKKPGRNDGPGYPAGPPGYPQPPGGYPQPPPGYPQQNVPGFGDAQQYYANSPPAAGVPVMGVVVTEPTECELNDMSWLVMLCLVEDGGQQAACYGSSMRCGRVLCMLSACACSQAYDARPASLLSSEHAFYLCLSPGPTQVCAGAEHTSHYWR